MQVSDDAHITIRPSAVRTLTPAQGALKALAMLDTMARLGELSSIDQARSIMAVYLVAAVLRQRGIEPDDMDAVERLAAKLQNVFVGEGAA
jgi:hypothetical protein